MVFVQVGVFTDNDSNFNTIRFPFTSGRWRVYYIGSAGQPRNGFMCPGDLRIQTFPNICRADPTLTRIIQSESGGTLQTGGNVIQPNQLLGISAGTVGSHKHFCMPWCIGEIDANECQTMIFSSGLYDVGATGARYTTLWFDAYRVD